MNVAMRARGRSGGWRGVFWRLVLAWTLVLAACTGGGGLQGQTPGNARALESRLVAPCCWVQTLDVHESEVATALRAEIAERLGRGEVSEAIEDDLAARYGERIRAVARGKEPRRVVPVILGGVIGAALLGVVFLLRRWTRRAPASSEAEGRAAAEEPDGYDDRLDDELARLGDR